MGSKCLRAWGLSSKTWDLTKPICITDLILLQKKALDMQNTMMKKSESSKMRDCSGFLQIRSQFISLRPYFPTLLYMHNFKTYFSPPFNHYNNRQTVNPMAAVGLMCRLLSDNVSSLLLSLIPKLYWLPPPSFCHENHDCMSI